MVVSDVDVEIFIPPAIGPTMSSNKVVSNENVVIAFDNDEWYVLDEVSCFELEVEVGHLAGLAKFVWNEAFNVEVPVFDGDMSVLLELFQESRVDGAARCSVVVECHGSDGVEEVHNEVVPIVGEFNNPGFRDLDGFDAVSLLSFLV